jgi:hypothetical protein
VPGVQAADVATRQRLDTARGYFDAAKRAVVEAKQYLEQNRNVVQAEWLVRALRERRSRQE